MNTLVLCSNPDLGLGVIRCLGTAGHRVYAMGIGSSPIYRHSRHCIGYESLQTDKLAGPTEQLTDRINSFAKRHRADVIVPTDLPAELLTDALRPNLRAAVFPVSDSATLQRLHDKWSFAQFLSANGLPHPATRVLDTPADLAGLDLPPPWVIKPRAGEGGVGVMKVQTAEQLAEIIRADPQPRLIQEFIPGNDIDVSFLADHGKIVAWTIQSAGRTASQKVFQNEPRVLEIAASIAAASAYHGVAHIDMRRDERDGSITVLEFNPRFWNTLVLSLCMGVNFPDLGLALMRGEELPAATTGPEGICRTFHATPWRLMRAMVSKRPPADLGTEAAGVWKQMGADPLPEFCRCLDRLRSNHKSAATAHA
jgi:glutathione synthase/RimK-type ligase-like ATP-grasp enzyme